MNYGELGIKVFSMEILSKYKCAKIAKNFRGDIFMTKKNNVPKVYFNHKGIEVEIDQKDIIKYEVAEELGVLDKAMEMGWKSLSAKETGKIGGIISKRKREETKETK